MALTTPFVRPGSTPQPLSPHAAAVDRLRRVLNGVRDAQEMLERLVRTGPDPSPRRPWLSIRTPSVPGSRYELPLSKW